MNLFQYFCILVYQNSHVCQVLYSGCFPILYLHSCVVWITSRIKAEKMKLYRYHPKVGNYLHLTHVRFDKKNFPRVDRRYVYVPCFTDNVSQLKHMSHFHVYTSYPYLKKRILQHCKSLIFDVNLNPGNLRFLMYFS